VKLLIVRLSSSSFPRDPSTAGSGPVRLQNLQTRGCVRWDTLHGIVRAG
jgi:hypothetical protein